MPEKYVDELPPVYVNGSDLPYNPTQELLFLKSLYAKIDLDFYDICILLAYSDQIERQFGVKLIEVGPVIDVSHLDRDTVNQILDECSG